MRFMTWNLRAGDSVAKLSRIDPPPDVAVFCEVRRQAPPARLGGPEPDWIWRGALDDRGVAIASWGHQLTVASPRRDTRPGSYSVGAELDNGLGVVGIWSCPPSGPMKSYAREIHATLDAFEDLLTSRPCVIAGDFNVDLGGDTDRRHGIGARLGDLGYYSAYHSFHGAEPGVEVHGTYFHQFKLSQPFHIDLVFLPESLLTAVRSIEVGTYDRWVSGQAGLRSDHVPLTVDIDMPPR